MVVFGNGTIKPQMASKYTPEMKFELKRGYLTKNHVMALDFWQQIIGRGLFAMQLQ